MSSLPIVENGNYHINFRFNGKRYLIIEAGIAFSGDVADADMDLAIAKATDAEQQASDDAANQPNCVALSLVLRRNSRLSQKNQP